MNKDEIILAIKKNIVRAVDNVSVDDIDPKRSMVDYGASSLDIVEVVSSTMRELRVKIPRTELNGITTIEGLVDIFYKHANPDKDV